MEANSKGWMDGWQAGADWPLEWVKKEGDEGRMKRAPIAAFTVGWAPWTPIAPSLVVSRTTTIDHQHLSSIESSSYLKNGGPAR